MKVNRPNPAGARTDVIFGAKQASIPQRNQARTKRLLTQALAGAKKTGIISQTLGVKASVNPPFIGGKNKLQPFGIKTSVYLPVFGVETGIYPPLFGGQNKGLSSCFNGVKINFDHSDRK